MRKGDLDTPAVISDVEVLERNIERMADLAAKNGAAIRPHSKTHKTREIAQMQLQHGACGITVAKVSEAEVMIAEGFTDIMLANEVIGQAKVDRLLELAGQARLSVAIDSPLGVSQLGRAAKRTGTEISVFVDLDTGCGRCGVPAGSGEAVELAGEISRHRGLRLAGLMTYEGHVYKARSCDEVRLISDDVSRLVLQEINAFRAAGLEVEVLSAGSSVSAPYVAASPAVTEIRPGTYVFNDVTQLRLEAAGLEDCALSVLATVVSGPRNGVIVLDAGSKTLSSDPASSGYAFDYVGYGLVKGMPGARIAALNEEHAMVSVDSCDAKIQVGSRLELIPNHACAVVNLHDELVVVEGERVRDVWRVVGRGKSR